MSTRIQVNKKIFSIRIKQIKPQTTIFPQVGVGIWRGGTRRIYTSFSSLESFESIKTWARKIILEYEGQFCTK